MHKINQNDVAWEERRSPKGKFHIHRKHLSSALHPEEESPFDIEMTCVKPGASNFPFHSHTTQWESYIILEGSGTLRTDQGEETIKKGDFITCKPGVPHQVINTSDSDLIYYVIADNPPADVFHYPDSEKYGYKPGPRFFTLTDANYYEGEE